MLSISTISPREPSWTNSPLWLSRPTGAPHGGRLSPIRTSCEQLRTSALRCPLVSGYLFISLKRLYFLSFFMRPFLYHFFCWPCRRFIGRGKLSDKNYVSLIEQHKLSKEYMMQAETFASNLRENLDKVRQTKAFKAYNSTFQFLSAATNVSYDSRSPSTIPQTGGHWPKINLTKQVRAARQSLHLLQRDRECDEPNAGNNLGDSRRNTGRAQF